MACLFGGFSRTRRQAFSRADGVVGGATDVGRYTARRPGIDMPAMPVGRSVTRRSNKSSFAALHESGCGAKPPFVRKQDLVIDTE